MNIIFISDKKYIIQSTVMLQSVFNNNNNVSQIFLLSTDINLDDLKVLINLCKKYNSKLHLISIDETELNIYDKIGPWSKYTFIKILIPRVIPKEIKKAIFLDVDMIVLDNLNTVYTQCSDEKSLYGVEDIPFSILHKDRCGIDYDSPYINSGFMVINLDKWREAYNKGQFEEFVKKNKGKMPFINDQDVINYVFQHDIGCLPYRYNVTNQAFGLHNKIIKKYPSVWKEGRKNPAIIHFTNSRKPWVPEVCHPYKKYWIKCLKQTEYSIYINKFKSYNIKWFNNYIKNKVALIVDFIRFKFL